jgi:hypothetical protein
MGKQLLNQELRKRNAFAQWRLGMVFNSDLLIKKMVRL